MPYEQLIVAIQVEVLELRERVDMLERMLERGGEAVYHEPADLFGPEPTLAPPARQELEPDEYSFEQYLVRVKGMKESTAKARASNCARVERKLGDALEHYRDDGGVRLLAKLRYTKEDRRRNLPPAHGLEIDGDIYIGTGTLRRSIELKLEYLHFLAQQAEEA